MCPEGVSIQLYGGPRDGEVVRVDAVVMAVGLYFVGADPRRMSPEVYRWDGTANPHGHARYRLE